MFAQTMGSCLLETFQSHVSQKSPKSEGRAYLQILQDLLMLLRRSVSSISMSVLISQFVLSSLPPGVSIRLSLRLCLFPFFT